MRVDLQVIDLECENINRTYFTPLARVTGKSTTTVAELKGFNEYIRSTPPKRYKVETWAGYSEQVAIPFGDQSKSCAGARYEWSGANEINLAGNRIQSYSRTLYTRCPSVSAGNPFWPLGGPVVYDFPGRTFGELPSLEGYCWSLDPNSCPLCDDSLPPCVDDPTLLVCPSGLQFITNQAAGGESPLYRAALAVQSSTLKSNSSTHQVRVLLSEQNEFPNPVKSYVTNFPLISYQPPGEEPRIAAWVDITSHSEYSSTLSNEYTDAEALANATVTHGNGLVAQNKPRTTGYASFWTTVDYTIHCSNLLAGEDYVAIVYLRGDDGSITTVPFAFTATGETHEITAPVPTPEAGHSTVVNGVTISYATP